VGSSIALVVDTSHTDTQHREMLKKSVERFVRTLPDGAEACIFSVSDQPVMVQEITDNHDELTRAVRRLRTGGRPSLLAGVQQAADHLRNSVTSDRMAVVLFTPARRSNEPMEDAIATLRNGKNVEFDAVAGPATGWQLQEQLQRLAVKTGGFALFPSKSGELSRVAEVAAHKLAPDGADVAFSTRGGDDRPQRAYTTLIVRNVAVADNPETKEFQSGDDELLQKMLIGKLQHDKIFPYVLDGRDEAQVKAPKTGGRVLELVTSIVQYRRGNRTQRRLIGAMGGAMVKVNVVLRDAISGRPVQAFMEKGSSSSGLFAGTNEEVEGKAIKEVVSNIADEVKKYGRRGD
jgi:hypothetical protein